MARAKKPVTDGKPAVSSSKTASKTSAETKEKAATDPKTASTTKPESSGESVTAKEKATPVGKPDSSEAAKGKTVTPEPAGKTAEPEKKEASVSPKAEPEKTAAKSSDKKPAVAPSPPPQPAAQRRSGFVALVAGGLIAGAIGFLVAEMNVLGTRPDIAGLRSDIAELTLKLTAQQSELAAMSERLDQSSTADATEVTDALKAGQDRLESALSAMEERITTLELRPVAEGADPELAERYAEELARLQNSVEAQKSEISALLADARSVEEATADLAVSAEQQAALARLTAALTSGEPFVQTLDDLRNSGVEDVPEGLSSAADTGVTPLTSLQTQFPDNARLALAAARATGAQPGEDGFAGFLRKQLGARSVAPREGDDPDAVLSRAEAAMREGRLPQALEELDGLPPEIQSAMQGWLDTARSRAAAAAAIEELSDRLSAN